MIRSLYTAASGMMAQQTNVDVISNNLANINTTGYKAESAEFKSLLYQNLQVKQTNANGEQKPVSAQVGLGVRTSSITSHFTQGALTESGGTFDFAIQGSGFFGVQGPDGDTYYTRNGNFYLAQGTEGLMLCTSEGYPVLSSDGSPIVFDSDIQANKIKVDSDGTLFYPDANNNYESMGKSIGVFQFSNPSGLEKSSSSLLKETASSGVAINEADDASVTKSKLAQGYLEGSNVQIASEMVNLITAQRAYELSSKAIQAADDMLQQANNLRR